MDDRFPQRGAGAEFFRDIRFDHQIISTEVSPTKPLAHAVTSGIISIFVWSHFHSAWCAFVSFVAGTMIDLDHLIDYYANHPYTANLKKIYTACLDMNLKKLYLVLHSYEFVILLWFTIYTFSLSDIWKAVAIGFTQHLIFDQIVNPITPLGYFLTYRIIKGFSKKVLIKEAKR